MKLLVNGQPFEFERQDDIVRFRWREEPEKTVQLCEVEPGLYSVLLDGASYEVRVEKDCVWIHGWRFAMDVCDPRRSAKRDAAPPRRGRIAVVALMPGKVVRLLVAEGDTVEAGQAVLVVEAMKMQNALRSPQAGRVVSLLAHEGATVAAGETLAVIE
ncbi:MAG: biotin/lipoyl-containing protein [Bryobacteraceae bacterium]